MCVEKWRKETESTITKKFHQVPENKIKGVKERYYGDLESRTQYRKRKHQEKPGKENDYKKR